MDRHVAARREHDHNGGTRRATHAAGSRHLDLSRNPIEHHGRAPAELRRRQVPQDGPPDAPVVEVGHLAQGVLHTVELCERGHRPVPSEHGRVQRVGGEVSQRRLARTGRAGQQQQGRRAFHDP